MELLNLAMEYPGSTGKINSWEHRVTKFRALLQSLSTPLLPFQYVAASCGFNGIISFLNCLWGRSLV